MTGFPFALFDDPVPGYPPEPRNGPARLSNLRGPVS